MLVRFDDKKPITFKASESSSHDTTILFIDDYSNFASKMLKSSKVNIQAEFYQEGPRVLEFNVKDFDVGKYRPKS